MGKEAREPRERNREHEPASGKHVEWEVVGCLRKDRLGTIPSFLLGFEEER